jgi:signal transduction histidine kinase/ABC-type amino acid transport substrate-binding protein
MRTVTILITAFVLVSVNLYSADINIFYSQYKPFVYTDYSGNLKGFDIDLIKGFCKELGYNCRFTPKTFNELLKSVSKNECDIAIGSIYINEDRKKRGLFSIPYLNSGLVAIVKNDFQDNYNSLMNKSVGVKTNATGHILAKKMKDKHHLLEIKEYISTYDSFMALAKNEVSWVINDYYNSLDMIYSNFRGEFKILTLDKKPLFFEKSEIGFYFPLEKTTLQKNLNSYLARLKDDKKLDELVNKWFYLTKPITIKEYLISTIITTSAGLISIFLIVIVVVLRVKNTKLRAYNAFLRSSLDLPSVAIIAFDENGKIVLWNKGAEKLIGFNEQDVKNIKEILSKTEDYNSITVQGNLILKINTKSSLKEFYVSIHKAEFYSARYILFGIDVSETIKALSSKLLYESLYYNVIENSSNAVVVLENGKVFLNKTFINLFNVKDKFTNFETLPDNIKEFLKKFIDSDKKARKYFGMENIIEGRIFDVSLIKDSIEAKNYYLAIFTDVTEKHQQQRLVELAEKDEAIANIVTSTVHDINNLLGVIINYASIIKLNNDENIQEPEKIIEVAEKCSEFLKSLNNLSKVSQDSTKIDIDSFLLQKYDFFKKVAGYNINLELKITDSGGYIVANEQKLMQAILNLIINAKDAIIGSGSIIIDKYIENGFIIISVTDTGQGIPDEIKSRIFERFYSTKGDKGTGLGLYAIKIFMENIKGDIYFKSKYKEGTTFYLKFQKVD